VSSLALLGVLIALFVRLFTKSWVPGWAGLFIAVLFMGGVQLICLGVVGEYVGRIYGEAKGRPLFLVDAERSVGANMGSDTSLTNTRRPVVGTTLRPFGTTPPLHDRVASRRAAPQRAET
jgi:hypothetical protein